MPTRARDIIMTCDLLSSLWEKKLDNSMVQFTEPLFATVVSKFLEVRSPVRTLIPCTWG